MKRFWDSVIRPLVDAAQPRVVVEVGTGAGDTTRLLLDHLEGTEAVVHSIDPAPDLEVAAWKRRYGERFVFHQSRSLGALPRIEGADLVLIDGDHNWYTVYHELKLIEKRSRSEGRPLPPILLHDVGWPYGRRDMYYDPESIPVVYRHVHRRRGILPDDPGLAETGGLNPHLENAIDEHDLRNGVRTALEDFVEESALDLEVVEIKGFHGLAVVTDRAYLERSPEFARRLKALSSAHSLRERLEELERVRVEAEIERSRLAAESSAAKAQATELKERIAAGDRDLEALRGSARELAAERDRLSARLAERELELARLEKEVGEADQRLEREMERVWRLRSEEIQASVRDRAELEAALERVRGDIERAVRSRSWRYAHRLARMLWALRGRRRITEGALDRALRRIELAEDRVGSRSAAGAPRRPAVEKADLAAQQGVESAEPKGEEDAPNLEAARRDEEARETFERRYAGIVSAGGAMARDGDLGGPLPLAGAQGLAPSYEDGDAAGPSVGGGPDGMSVDVVVCVHNALEDVKRCLWALVNKAGPRFHLILVDDGSDGPTASFLDAFTRDHPAAELIRNSSPSHGYTVAANLGLRASRADYVVLLNSDTEVTPGWLERIVECGESDESIGVIGPLSNAASHQSIPERRDGEEWAVNPLPSWLTPDGMGYLVDRLSEPTRPRVPFINGFCYVIKRRALEDVGLFDEVLFAEGYCEENDFSLRAASAGFKLAVADDAYVHHAKSSSYGSEERTEVARRHYARFTEKHGAEMVGACVRRLESDQSLTPLRERVGEAIQDLDAFRRAFRDVCPNPLRIGFVLPGMAPGGSGGAHSVYQEAAGMRELGIEARILLPGSAHDLAREVYGDADDAFTFYTDERELADRTDDLDVIVATHFKSVGPVARLLERRAFLPAHYIQDYEPFFTDEDSPETAEAAASYAAVPGMVRFAKTHWLCNLVELAHGVPVAKVEPSVDHSLFHPPDSDATDGPTRVVAMVRPRTARRQPYVTLRALERLQRELGDAVEVRSFGCSQEAFDLLRGRGAEIEHAGLLTREEVADLLKASDLFLDLSVYQAFGRTALEAMSCGCAVVVPAVGGPREFAVDGENALLLHSSHGDRLHSALLGLIEDRSRLRSMQSAAAGSARRYSVLGAAISEYVLLEGEHRRRASDGRPPAGASAAEARGRERGTASA